MEVKRACDEKCLNITTKTYHQVKVFIKDVNGVILSQNVDSLVAVKQLSETLQQKTKTSKSEA